MHLTRNQKEECVVARIMRQKKNYQRSFFLSQYQTWEKAEQSAAQWLEELRPTLPPSEMNSKGRMTVRNHSGVVGVYLVRKKIRKPSGNEYEYWSWVARWPECPFKGGLGWMIGSELSDEDAFALAVLSRQMQSIDRKAIKTRFKRIYGKASHLALLEKKQQFLD